MISVAISIWSNSTLIRRLVRREIERRFKGTVFGLVWAVLVPLLMLATYSFAFGTVFGARWVSTVAASPDGEIPYPLAIFSGLILASVFMDVLARSPGLVLENVSYVKKVVFPLEILPVVALGSALFTAAISFGVFLCFYLYAIGMPSVTALLAPFAVVPLFFLTLGLCYFLASLGVFLRDLGQIIPPLTTAVLLTSTTFFQIDQLPAGWQRLVWLNPLAIPITAFRDLLFHARMPDLVAFSAYTAASLLVLAAGAWWFQRTKRAFADVV